MNCSYCQAECVLRRDVPISPKVDLWWCESCLCNFNTRKDGVLLYSSWRVDVENKHYFIKSYDGVTGNSPEFVIYYETTNSEGKQYWEDLKRFNFVPPDWNPKNSQHKLKTYLPFL